MVRDLARRVLEQGGYAVLVASSAGEALPIAEGSAALHLVITDVVMPGGMSGVQIGERLAHSRPRLPVLYMSGYTEDATHQNAEIQVLRDENAALKARLALVEEKLGL